MAALSNFGPYLIVAIVVILGIAFWLRRLVGLALVAAVLALVLVPMSGFGSRLGLWSFFSGFMVLGIGVLTAVLGLLAALISFFRGPANPSGSTGTARLAALVISGILVAVPLSNSLGAFTGAYAPIHDITTDTDNPPQFDAVMEARGEGSNSVDYASKTGRGGEQTYAEIQQDYYPDIGPVTLDAAPDAAFDQALAAAEAMGWEIVAADKEAGRIEATATTFWFGFKDDVVIRVTAEGGGSRVDVRSTSRVGMGDIGANANRVRAYTERLRAG